MENTAREVSFVLYEAPCALEDCDVHHSSRFHEQCQCMSVFEGKMVGHLNKMKTTDQHGGEC